MQGKNHLLIALLLASINLNSMISHDMITFEQSIFLLFGIAIGSLLPDVDAGDTLLYHPKNKLLRKFNVAAKVFPIIGIVTTWFIYKPVSFILGFKEKHRGFLHSLTGLTFVYIGWSIIAFAIQNYLQLEWTQFFNYYLIIIGLFIGGIIHLIEDSYTRSGVQWLYPLNFRISGSVITGKNVGLRTNEDFLMLYFLITAGLITTLNLDPTGTLYSTIGAILLAFIIFFKI